MKLQTTKLFSGVWGAGPATAEKWWAEGCRSLGDAEQREDLSQRQVRRMLGALHPCAVAALSCDMHTPCCQYGKLHERGHSTIRPPQPVRFTCVLTHA